MNNVTKLLCGAAVGLMSITSLQANTLVNVLDYVEEHHPRIVTAAYEVATAEARIRAVRTGYWPYIEVDYELTDAEDDHAVRAVLPIWRGGVTGAESNIEKTQFQRAQALLAQARLDLAAEVTSAYFELLAQLDQAALDDNNVREHERLLRVIQKRAQAGVSPKSDVETARARLEVSRAQHAATVAAVDSAHARLISLSGVEIAKGDVTWPGQVGEFERWASLDVRAVAETHPRSLVAVKDISIARREIDLRKRRALPEFLLVHERAYTEGEETNKQTGLQMQFRGQRTNRALADKRVERLTLEASSNRYQNTLLEVRQRLNVLVADALGAEKQMVAQAVAVKSTRYLVGSFRRQFEAGKKTWLEVLNAQREAYQNERLLIGQRAQYWTSLISLQLESGQRERLAKLYDGE